MAQSEENAGRLLRSQAAPTQHDAGLISYTVLQQNGASNHFTIVETWRDTRSYELHQGVDHTVEFRKDIQPFLGGPFDSREHHLFC
jgi:quinol monooxygenase YgiN